MPTRRFERTRLAQLLLSGCAPGAFALGACVMVAHAQPQYIPPPTPLPPPVFNPSTPYTVPQAPYRPIAPSAPSVSPGYVTAPVNGRVAHTPVRSQQRTAAAARPSAHHHRHAVAVRATPEAYSYSYAPFGYGYSCAWQRSWDGYWFRTSPCS
jgi:hypothetical protein